MPGHLENRSLLRKRVLVSRRSYEGDERPRFVYREEPDDRSDSGWRVVTGEETHAEVDDPGNIVVQPLSALVERWPELRPVFETDPRTDTWAWDDVTERYVPIAPE